MKEVTTVGLDLAKSVFQVHAVDAAGSVVPNHSPTDNFCWLSMSRAELSLASAGRLLTEVRCLGPMLTARRFDQQQTAKTLALWPSEPQTYRPLLSATDQTTDPMVSSAPITGSRSEA